jgi:hypothetical protein
MRSILRGTMVLPAVVPWYCTGTSSLRTTSVPCSRFTAAIARVKDRRLEGIAEPSDGAELRVIESVDVCGVDVCAEVGLGLRKAPLNWEVEVDPALDARVDARLFEARLLGTANPGAGGAATQLLEPFDLSVVDRAVDPYRSIRACACSWLISPSGHR